VKCLISVGLIPSFCADILLEKGQIEASEIWDIYKRAPRIPQVSS